MNPNYRKLQEFFGTIISDPEYRRRFRQRAVDGELPAMVERSMFEYFAGKVKDELEVTHNLAQEIANAPEEDVLNRHQALTQQLLELRASRQRLEIVEKEAADRDDLGVVRVKSGHGVH